MYLKKDTTTPWVAWFNFVLLSWLAVWASMSLLQRTCDSSSSSSSSCPQENSEGCETPFGSVLGYAHGVPAFSNCHCQHIAEVYTGVLRSDLSRVIDYHPPSTSAASTSRIVFTGMKWQCVEYARRFLVSKRRLAFGDVDGAEDIWTLASFSTIDSPGHAVVVEKLRSDSCSDELPKPGDLVIWKRQEGMPYGHVAVVVSIGPPTTDALPSEWPQNAEVPKHRRMVYIAEQNFESRHWAHATNYSRELTLEVSPRSTECQTASSHRKVKLLDPHHYEIIGWVHPK